MVIYSPVTSAESLIGLIAFLTPPRTFNEYTRSAAFPIYRVPGTMSFRNLTGITVLESDGNEAKATQFLADPARTIQVFLSSYMRTQGLIWSDRKLVSTPHLLRFFVKYLLRNQTIPDAAQGLNNALNIIDVAAKELLLLPRISEVLPDTFAKASAQCWGRKDEEFFLLAEMEKRLTADASKGRRPKFDRIVRPESRHINQNSNRGSVPVNQAPQISAEGLSSGWGSGGGWGSTDSWGSSGDWPTASITPDPPGPPPPPLPPPPSMLKLLGPTVLPFTHAPGVVEYSTRRIKSLLPPMPIPAHSAQLPGAWAPSAEAIERDLEARMWRVVMAPWTDWDADPAVSRPRIVPTSCGTVVVPGQQPASGAHDMLADEITVLVDPAAVDNLCIGMGTGGTWVQLVRLPDGGSDTGRQGGTRKNRKVTENRKGVQCYWYLQDLVAILPSYWAI
ncbi:hypothetical protein FB451DRAFT_1472592 [Mycena latifolia]|nr:hypothetical protein FB451DRAFT_1472592 [Mycena latifolia]